GQEPPQGHPLRQVYPANVWPAEIPGLEEVALQLYLSLELCAETLLQALADYFSLPQDTFSSMMQNGNSILRAIHYPPLPEAPPAGSVRAAAHEDINLITLLSESKGSGLEILTHEGTWKAIGTLDGDIVVDSGDMLSRITNGVIPATTHRVVNPEQGINTSRYSIPFFVHPYPTCDLSVMPAFVSEQNPERFEPISAQEFLDQRLREIGLLGD
ncbi:MAG: 2OG-Fe(II) oxygenase family protein, partial [Myxococcota bacterium]